MGWHWGLGWHYRWQREKEMRWEINYHWATEKPRDLGWPMGIMKDFRWRWVKVRGFH